MSRRLRIASIQKDLLAKIIAGGASHTHYVEGWPWDAKIIDMICLDDTLLIKLQSYEFSEIPSGGRIPTLDLKLVDRFRGRKEAVVVCNENDTVFDPASAFDLEDWLQFIPMIAGEDVEAGDHVVLNNDGDVVIATPEAGEWFKHQSDKVLSTVEHQPCDATDAVVATQAAAIAESSISGDSGCSSPSYDSSYDSSSSYDSGSSSDCGSSSCE